MSHNSLTIRVDLQIGTVDHIAETIKATEPEIRRLTRKRIPSLTSFICKDIGSGTLGIAAWFGVACRTDGFAVQITEMYSRVNTELKTAQTFAHELGHTIGMM